jgi:hypothetical protein
LTLKRIEESLTPPRWGSLQKLWASSPQSSSKTRLYDPESVEVFAQREKKRKED